MARTLVVKNLLDQQSVKTQVGPTQVDRQMHVKLAILSLAYEK